jgi:pentatricopeptide repeat protein
MQAQRALTLLRSRGAPSVRNRGRRWLSAEKPDQAKNKPVLKSFFDQVDDVMSEQRKQSAKLPKETQPFFELQPHRKVDDSSQAVHRRNPSAQRLNESVTDYSAEKSLFDVFKIPDPPPARSPTAFDATACEHYQEMLVDIISNDRKFRRQHTAKPIPDSVADAVVAWLRSEEPTLPQELPSFQQALQEGVQPLNPHKERSGTFVEETSRQKKLFLEKMGWNERQFKMAKGVLVQISNLCAKKARGQPLEVIWEKIKEAGVTDKKTLHNMLYVSATFSTGNRRKKAKYGRLAGLSILDVLDAEPPFDGSSDGQQENEELVDMTDEIAIYHDLLHNPTEQSINIRVRLLVSQGNAKEAERLLNDHSEGEMIRLRAYTPILRLYLEQGDVSSALQLYKRMKSMPLVHFDAETYVHLIAGMAEKGVFAPSALPIGEAKQLGYSAESGPCLFDELVAEMAQEVIEIPSASALRLYNAIVEGFPQAGLEKTQSLSPLKVSTDPADGDELIASRVSIRPATGECERSGTILRLIDLKENEREKLRQSVLTLARTEQVRFVERNKIARDRRSDVRADEELAGFYRELDERKGEAFTAVVDGPNVGYYMQNYDEGRFSFHQIKFVVESLESLGERPLVVLPRKYCLDSFFITIGSGGGSDGYRRKQILAPEEIAIRDNLIDSGKVYVVPPGLLDDFYWILASVSQQTASRKGKDLYVPPGDPSGRWAGTRPFLVSNDLLSDHKLEMMEPMLFRRWYANFIINYNFSAFVRGECNYPEMGFSHADFFSREIQANPSENNSQVWHFPLSDMGDDDWFCVRIPNNEKVVKKDRAL